MIMKQKTAIILGATGLTGSLLLNQLIHDDNFTSIKLFSRRTLNCSSPKIKEYIGDLLRLEQFKSEFTADVVFCCIGTTAAKTKDKELYKAIDFGIPAVAAKLAKENNIPTFIVISALGANAKSKIFYNQTKGEMEYAVLSLKIPNTFILRPSLIVGERNETRFWEKLAVLIMKPINSFLIGKLKKYRSIKAGTIATAMRVLEKKFKNQIIVESDNIEQISEQF